MGLTDRQTPMVDGLYQEIEWDRNVDHVERLCPGFMNKTAAEQVAWNDRNPSGQVMKRVYAPTNVMYIRLTPGHPSVLLETIKVVDGLVFRLSPESVSKDCPPDKIAVTGEVRCSLSELELCLPINDSQNSHYMYRCPVLGPLYGQELRQAERWTENRFISYHGRDDLYMEKMTNSRLAHLREYFNRPQVRHVVLNPQATTDQVEKAMPEISIFETRPVHLQNYRGVDKPMSERIRRFIQTGMSPLSDQDIYRLDLGRDLTSYQRHPVRKDAQLRTRARLWEHEFEGMYKVVGFMPLNDQENVQVSDWKA